jgi:hypothetical protein
MYHGPQPLDLCDRFVEDAPDLALAGIAQQAQGDENIERGRAGRRGFGHRKRSPFELRERKNRCQARSRCGLTANLRS